MSAHINYLERKSYDQAIKQKCPIAAGINRIYLIQLREQEEKVERISVQGVFQGNVVKSTGGIYLAEKSKEKITSKNEVVKAIVKAVGPTHDGRECIYKENDLVFVFPSVFETKIVLDEIDYFSYSDRDIVGSKPYAETIVQRQAPRIKKKKKDDTVS